MKEGTLTVDPSPETRNQQGWSGIPQFLFQPYLYYKKIIIEDENPVCFWLKMKQRNKNKRRMFTRQTDITTGM